MRSKIRKIEVLLRQFYWAFKESFKPTTYSIVKYHGAEFYIKSSLTGHNIWDLYPLNGKVKASMFFHINPNKGCVEQIHGSQLQVLYSWKKFKEDFKSHLDFQKSYWGLIDEQKPIGTRLSYINSENIKH
jgi:hypothetical protein